VFIGWHPNTDFLDGVADLGEKGDILVDQAMKTSEEGLFACGDCRKKVLHQVVIACGDGAIAGHSAQEYVADLKGTAYK
jgi:thioredoxin reductase (NADPH)